MTDAYLGLDINGLVDSSAVLDDPFATSGTAGLNLALPVVVVSAEPNARPICGAEAIASLEGRGWQWPTQARVNEPEQDGAEPMSSRLPILRLLQRISKGTESVPTPYGNRGLDLLLGAHLRHLAGDATSGCIAIPDDFSEDAQQLLLDAARRAVSIHQGRRIGFSARLLWRPVAALLGWAQGQPAEFVRSLHGTRALVIHRLPDGFSASILGLEVDASTADWPLLTPVRSRTGTYKASLASSVSLAEKAARAYASVTHDSSLYWQSLWGTGHAWQGITGAALSPVLMQRQDGSWVVVSGMDPDANGATEEAIDDAVQTAKLLQQEWKSVKFLLVECPLGPEMIGGLAYGQHLLRRLQHLRGFPGGVQVVECAKGIVAHGCAVYQARLAQRLPTYFDYLPHLDINALVECRQQFVSLMPEQTRIPGGERFGPLQVDHGFAVQAQAKEITFLIARDTRVRKTVAHLPLPPGKDARIELWVSQAPAQGNAQVEIRPALGADRGLFGGGTVLLDWRRNLDAIQNTRAEVEQQWVDDGGLPFPPHQPTQGHWALWAGLGIPDRIKRFLDAQISPNAPSDEYRRSVDDLFDAFRVTQNPAYMRNVQCHEDGKFRAIGCDGQPPKDLDDKLRWRVPRPVDGMTVAKLYSEMILKLGSDFAAIDRIDYVSASAKDIHRRLILTAAWCYAGAPESVIAYFRKGLAGRNPRNWGFAVEGASRVLTNHDDMKRHFKAAQQILFDGQHLSVAGKTKWIKGVSQILSYREDAPLAMTQEQATIFALAAAKSINEELSEMNIQRTFYSSVMLLLLVLRYRRNDCSFLKAEGRQADKVREIEEMLEKARMAAAQRNPQAAHFIDETLKFLHFRGTEFDIIKKLAAEAGD